MGVEKLAKKIRTPLFIIITVEILGVIFLVLGVFPREVALFLLGIFVFFILFSPLKQGLLFTAFSIPLFTAVPLSESFDEMAAWRIVVTILFLKAALNLSGSRSVARADGLRRFVIGTIRTWRYFVVQLLKTRIGVFVCLFFLTATLSLFVATDPIFGIRKLAYLANALGLFFVVWMIAKTKKDFLDIVQYTFGGVIAVLLVGYAQFIAVHFAPLHAFWQWWASHVIPVFYGANLSHLLSYSNTWFSYYEEAEATLRVFSIFPDSHSFALSMVLALPVALTFFAMSESRHEARFLFGAFVFLALLAVVFSGTRGVWVGAVPVFFVVALVFLIQNSAFRKNFPIVTSIITRVITPKLDGFRRNTTKTCVLVFFVFALLFPVASQIQKISQWRQGGEISDTTTFSRIYTSFRTEELSNKGRIQIWKSTLESVVKHPFLGVGIGNYPVVLSESISATKEGASAHSLYLDFVAEIGVFGGIVVLLIFLEIFRKAIRVFIQGEDLFFIVFSGFFAVFLLWVMAYSAVDVVLLNDKVLLLFVTLLGLLYAIPKERVLIKKYVNSFHNNRGEK